MRNKMRILITSVLVISVAMSSMFNVFAQSKGNENKNKNKLENLEKRVILNIAFKDVNKDFWGYKAISELVNRGVINGYADKSFKPSGKVTRSEFATMLTKALALTATSNGQTFVDVKPESWDFSSVEAAKACLTGYKTSDGSVYFYGNKEAVREDMALALVKALKLPVEKNESQLQQIFKDYNGISTNLIDYVYTAYKNNLMIGSEGKFAPGGALTRAEAAALLYKALNQVEKVVMDENSEEKIVMDSPVERVAANTDASLSALAWNDTALANFEAATLTYNVLLPVGTTLVPSIRGTVYDIGKAKATITQASSLPGTANVLVTAEDGISKKNYILNFSVAQAPKSTDASLSLLSYNATNIEGFRADTLIYNVLLPVATTLVPTVAASAHALGVSTVTITQATALPGTANIVVTAEDGISTKVYSIFFTLGAQ